MCFDLRRCVVELEAAVKLVSQYGFPAVVLVAVLLWLRAKLDRLFYLFIETKLACSLPPELEHRARTDEFDAVVLDALQALLSSTRANRAYVFLYHNGGRTISGISFSRLTCTHERVSGALPQQKELRNLLKSMVRTLTDMVDYDDGVWCPDVDECFCHDVGLLYLLQQQNVASIYCVGLYDIAKDGTHIPLGLIGLDYCGQKHVLLDAHWSELVAVASMISGFIKAFGQATVTAAKDRLLDNG